MGDRPGLDRGGVQCPDHRLGHDLEIPLVTNPAFFPDVVERLVLSPIVVNKVDGLCRMAQQPGGTVALGNAQGRGAVTRGQLQRTRGLGATLLGAHHEDRAAATGHRLQRRDQGRGASPLRAGDVERAQAVPQVQSLRDDAGVLPVLEGQAGRCQVEPLDNVTVTVGAAQRIAGRFDRHRDGILVPVGDGPLALAKTLETGIEPGVGRGNDLALQSPPGHVAAKGVDSN